MMIEGAIWFGLNELFSSLFPDNSWCPWNVTVHSTIKEKVFWKKLFQNVEGCLWVWFSICPLRHAHHHLPPQHLPHRHHHHVVKAKQAHAHINLLREAGALSQLPWTPESNISGLSRLLFVFRRARCTKLLDSKSETSDLRCQAELKNNPSQWIVTWLST